MFDRINGFLLQKGQDDLLANKPILKLLKQFILCSREENVSQEMEVMSCFLLLPENKVFPGFWYFAKLMNECTDEIIVRKTACHGVTVAVATEKWEVHFG